MALQWTAALATSVNEIDGQHQELFTRVNRMLDAVAAGAGREEVERIVGFLSDYVTLHFGTEERYMDAYGYANAPQHKAQHRQFVKNFLRLKEQLMSGGATPALVSELRALAVDWLINHITFSDRALGMFLKRKLPAGAPAPTPQPAVTAPQPAAARLLSPQARLQWSDLLSTSVKEIDDQHKELIGRINGLLEAVTQGRGRQELEGTIQFLADYVVLHFGTEERHMERFAYPDERQHKAQHAQFIKSFMRVKDRLLAGAADQALVEDTRQLVVDWLVNHIKLSDRALGLFLKRKLA